MSLTPAKIASALRLPAGAIEAHWPLIVAGLEGQGISSDLVRVAAAATVAVETGNFRPVEERGGVAYFAKHYEGRKDLGNTEPGDGARFHGRGFIQITGRANYRTFGKIVGVDLEAHPDMALEPAISANILARYFKDRGIDRAAEAQDWLKVRRRVNGGTNGMTAFQAYVNALLEVMNG